MLTFDPKTPDETVTLGLNFKKLLAAGETIVSATSKMTDSSGVDVSSAMLYLVPDITGAPVIRQKVLSGSAGETYLFEVFAVTSNGQTFVGQAKLPVSSEI